MTYLYLHILGCIHIILLLPGVVWYPSALICSAQTASGKSYNSTNLIRLKQFQCFKLVVLFLFSVFSPKCWDYFMSSFLCVLFQPRWSHDCTSFSSLVASVYKLCDIRCVAAASFIRFN